MENLYLGKVIIKENETIIFNGSGIKAKEFLEKNIVNNGELIVSNKHIIYGDNKTLNEALLIENNKMNVINLYSRLGKLEDEYQNNESKSKCYDVLFGIGLGSLIALITCAIIMPKFSLAFILTSLVAVLPTMKTGITLSFIKKDQNKINDLINSDTTLINKITEFTNNKWNELCHNAYYENSKNLEYTASPILVNEDVKQKVKIK